MRAWIVHQFGPPAEVLQLDEQAPDFSPGEGQVKVQVEAAGLGLPDVFMCADNYPLTPALPFTPSQEAAGKVVAVGAGVDPALLGTRVLGPTLFRDGRGGLAEFCLMHAQAAFPIPGAMTGEEAAGFFIPFQTAWISLVRRGQLTAADTVLVLGASGSSGCAAVQLARARGARVIAVAGGPRKTAFCQGLGADAVIDHRAQDITSTTLELTDGKGASVVYDPVGGKAGRAAFKATAFEGRFLVIGYASGEWPDIKLPETLPRNISLVGAMPVGFSPQLLRQAHDELLEHWQQGQLQVANNQVFAFEDAVGAIEHIAGGRVEGKVVVRVAGS
ncbi:MAG: NADPH:quinone oxidoreductase family protein [Pseudomonadales bacterium]|nr:NADPH:quinone oxidoreductase family protein [Halieaceae bacterium]MCP5164133.1 NADPH:quinone oxidoreductase family protein [Pseudomonadales bacterium]MCP5190489.1 NADPH:quinone oxidoreductase family protein [Pseudomonadales bacterium]MCP5203791.1 NADPH:quinone oxidoreductase family protein [Pseudomonadales bacterium]